MGGADRLYDALRGLLAGKRDVLKPTLFSLATLQTLGSSLSVPVTGDERTGLFAHRNGGPRRELAMRSTLAPLRSTPIEHRDA